jgi:hypothetical protein
MDRLKDYANTASGFLGFAAPAYFAWTIYRDGIPQNIATWGMTFLLDALGLFLVYRAGNKRPLMQLGWMVACFCIFIAVCFSKSPWHWGWVETASLLLCGVTVILYLAINARIAIFAFAAAMVVATFPLLVDYWRTPQPSTLWMWTITALTCLLSIYGAKQRDIAHVTVPWTAVATNIFIAYLCIR